MFSDYHVHTEFSDDSVEPMENVVQTAITLKMNEICFSDHVDYGIKCDQDEFATVEEAKENGYKELNVDYPKYFKKIEELQTKYRNQITIKKGLEFGMQTFTIPRFQELFNTYALDFVILSCHQVENQEFWTYDFQKGKGQDEYIARYYQEIYDCILAYKDYSVLGHLDMIQRYTEPRYPFEKAKEMITKILKQVIKDGKGIEVNTSSFQYQLPDLMPEKNILQLYYELGGTIITVGSDCHKAERLGDHIEYIYGVLKEIGFQHICTFENMKPIYYQL